MNIHLKALLKNWPCTVYGQKINVNVISVTEQSTKVKAGSVFVARKGKITDGLVYVEEAIEKGAVAIVTDRPPQEVWQNEVPLIVVSDCLLFLAFASAELAGHPAKALNIIAITGTNGKTTVAHYIGQLLLQANRQVAVIGTIGVYINGKKTQHIDCLTTLTAEQLQPILQACVAEGITDIVMEASSMGLAQHRLAYCPIDIGVLLNIGEDHYEEHGGKEQYLLAKQRLVDEAAYLFVNETSDMCKALCAHRLEKKAFFSPEQFKSYSVQVQKELETLVNEAQHFEENIAAALAVANKLQLPIKDLSLQWPEGRMERVQLANIKVYIDYAHTPEALQYSLEQLKQQPYRKLMVVFGCGGNRHQEKRQKMGRIVSQYGDTLYVTSDNPRNEQPQKIIKDILEGVDKHHVQTIIEVDRKKAIQLAIQNAQAGDVIVIAGKGHERFQEIGQQKIAFSDRQIAYEALGKYHL